MSPHSIHRVAVVVGLFCLSTVGYAQSTNSTATTHIRVFLEGMMDPSYNPERTPLRNSEDSTVPEMVTVRATETIGKTYHMGNSREGQEGDEFPSTTKDHQVIFRYDFEVGKYEITIEEFRAFAVAKGLQFNPNARGGNCDGRNWDRGLSLNRHPVGCMSYDATQAYVKWLTKKTGLIDNEDEYTAASGFRLLTEAEWEYAAKGVNATTATRYSNGKNTITTREANYASQTGTVAVGSYKPNPFGLYDVHGNVWEIVEDCSHANYFGAPNDGSAWTDNCSPFAALLQGNATNAKNKLARGGSYSDVSSSAQPNTPIFLRSTNRLFGQSVIQLMQIVYTPNNSSDTGSLNIGFRIARTCSTSCAK